MAEPGSSPAGARPPGPEVRPVPCANCATPVDPLRAARVAIFHERFRYFCSPECRASYRADSAMTPLPLPRRRKTPATPLAAPDPAELRATELRHERALEIARLERDAFDAVDRPRSSEAPAGPSSEDTDVATLLLALAMVGGGLSVALVLLGGTSTALAARLVVVLVAAGALVAEYVMGDRDAAELHPGALLPGPVLSTLAALVARLAGHPRAASAITLAGVTVASAAAGVWLVGRARRLLVAERERLDQALDAPARRVVGEEIAVTTATDLRPGEEIVLEPGDVAAADVTLSAGSAEVTPWLDADVTRTVTEGDPLVAGARVVSGRLRAVVTWSGRDRAWTRLTRDERRRADLHAPMARAGRLIAVRGAPIAALGTALAGLAAGWDGLGIALGACAAQSALAQAGLAEIGALHVVRTVLEALKRGVAFRTAAALDRAGRASAAVFCARGTLLLGEPEVTNIEALGASTSDGVLALAAGAEGGVLNPVASAVQRAARARGVRPDAVRSPTLHAGLGVTAVSGNGEPAVVGSRALMLRERVSVALAEGRITELEALGRTVLLVALGGRLLGLVALQDGLRPGARAAVQHLLDVEVEPVLLSGDTRETCEALARSLDVDHVRPEVLPSERGEVIRRLSDAGAVVAVIGRTPADDAALAAAEVSVALACAGSGTAEWNVQLASDDVRDAAHAVRIARLGRAEGRLGIWFAAAPALLGVIVVAFGAAPPIVAPLLSTAGAAVALLRLRSLDET